MANRIGKRIETRVLGLCAKLLLCFAGCTAYAAPPTRTPDLAPEHWFDAADRLEDDALERVSGEGLSANHVHLSARGTAVILWDERNKLRHDTASGSNPSRGAQTVRSGLVVR